MKPIDAMDYYFYMSISFRSAPHTGKTDLGNLIMNFDQIRKKTTHSSRTPELIQ